MKTIRLGMRLAALAFALSSLPKQAGVAGGGRGGSWLEGVSVKMVGDQAVVQGRLRIPPQARRALAGAQTLIAPATGLNTKLKAPATKANAKGEK